MSLTMFEIKEKLLERYEVDDLVEALDVTSEELLDRFEDKLINRLDSFEEELNEETTEETYTDEQH
jgi:adenylate kinase family enzyme